MTEAARWRDAYSLGYRSAQILGAGALAAFVVRTFDPVSAGLFFTLTSVLGAQALLDFGCSTLVVNFLSHEMVDVQRRGPTLVGSEDALARIGWILRGALVWGGVTAAIALIALDPLAIALVGHRPEVHAVSHWPWIVHATIAGLVLAQAAAPIPLVQDGIGNVAVAARFRFLQECVGYGAALFALLAGAGVWSLAILWLVRAGLGLGFSVSVGAPLLASTPRWRTADLLWRRDIAPVQGRLAASWAAGFLAQQTTVPIAYFVFGPAEAGRVGLALFMTNGIVLVSLGWVSARAPEYGRLIAARSFGELDALVRRATTIASGTAVLGVTAALALIALIQRVYPAYASRLPTLAMLALFGCSGILVTAIGSLATAMRARKIEPLLVVSVLGGLVTPPMLYLSARLAGPVSMAASIFLLQLLVGVPWTLIVYRRVTRIPNST